MSKENQIIEADAELVDDGQSVPALVTRTPIADALKSGTLDKYLYSFKTGQSTVTDLNADGINALAAAVGVSIDDVKILEETEEHVTVQAVAINADGHKRFGIVRESKRRGNRDNPYALQSAVSKAQRNALKALCPMAEVRNIIKSSGHTPIEDN